MLLKVHSIYLFRLCWASLSIPGGSDSKTCQNVENVIDSLRRKWDYPPSILAWRIYGQSALVATVHRVAVNQTLL